MHLPPKTMCLLISKQSDKFMKQTTKDHKKKLWMLVLTFLTLTNIFTIKPAKSFIPYIYEPKEETIKNTSLSIGRTAAQLLQLGQPKEAVRLAELAVRLDPKDEMLWSILAEAQLRSDQPEKAKRSLKKAKKINPKKANLWFAEATIALQTKEVEEAISLLKQGLKLEPKNAGGYFHLGNARIMQTNFKLALKAFEKASKLKPSFWEALNNKGLVLFEIDQTQLAIETWRKVLKINLNAEPMLALAAAINKNNSQSEESIELAEKALAQNPNYVLSSFQAKQLWGTKLQAATSALLSNPALNSVVERAKANSNP